MRPTISAALLLVCACGNHGSSDTPAGDDGGGDDGGVVDSSVPDTADAAAPAYQVALLTASPIVSDGSKPNFQNATAPVQLKEPSFTSVKLVVDLTSPCFPFAKWKTDEPPSGQNWPADCDAFDRNFEMSLEEPSTGDAGADAGPPPVGIELQRAISPFGGPEHVETDVTDVFNGLHGAARTFKVIVTAYSDGAGKVSGSAGKWTVDAHLEVQPGPAPRNVLAVLPLTYTSVSDGGKAHDLPFTLPAGTTGGKIEYRVTGHGGGDATGDANCIGPSDEFCKRTHTLTIDGAALATIQPWRSDCTKNCTVITNDSTCPFQGGYCKQNPCGDQNSVRAPRANWCPGTPTPPFSWTPDALKTPGAHTLSYTIDKIGAGGGWRVSAVVYAYGS
jgi:hypothetical protein